MTDLAEEANDSVLLSRRLAGPRTALVVFVVAIVVSAPVLLLWAGRGQWFILDEWTVLSTRLSFRSHSVFLPYNSHWVTVPLVLYKGVWSVFKLSSYRPYQALTITSHLAVVGLVRVILRRNGVCPWVASIGAGVLLFLGTGASDIVQGWQVTFTLPLALGFAALVLGDHSGPWCRRDWFAMCCLVVALASSAVGVAMLITVCVTMFLRRGARVGAAYLAPAALAFLGWYAIWGRSTQGGATVPRSYGGGVLWDAVKLLWHSLLGIGGLGDTVSVAVATALVAIVAGGFMVLVFRQRSFASVSSGVAVPIGLLFGAASFALMVTVSRRILGLSAVYADRYVYVVVVLLVPAIVIVSQVASTDRRPLALLVVLVMCVGVPGNVGAFDHIGFGRAYTVQQRELVLSIAAQPGVHRLPGDVLPFWMGPTAGWLVAGDREGWMPHPDAESPTLMAISNLMVSLTVTDPNATGVHCGAPQATSTARLRRGGRIVIEYTRPNASNPLLNGVRVERLNARNSVVASAMYPEFTGRLFTSYADGLAIRLTSTSPSLIRICRTS